MTKPAVRILPVTQQAPVEGACCGACAGEAAAVEVAAAPLRPVLSVRPARPTISRTDDRRITFGGVALAAALLALALATSLLPEAARRGLWLPLHLGLAGAAGTAVAAVLPFFTAALTVAPPAATRIRVAAVGLIAGGALVVSGGVAWSAGAVAVAGGLLYLAGLACLGFAAFAPLRGSLGPRRRLVERAYAAALVQVAIGVVLATAMLANVAPVVERWALLKPAHAWLNVLGFVSIVIAATLLHLAPTVAGTRIRPRRSATIAILGLAVGAPLVALGLALANDVLARAGAVLELGGAAALVAHGLAVWRDRGRWTTDAAWHRLTGWSLTIAPVWLLVAVAIAAGRVLAAGAAPGAWSLDVLAAPLAIGWAAQVVIGSWSHIVPAIGPGDMPAHARQRAILGRAAVARVAILNAGVALATLGGAVEAGGLVALGALLVAAALATALALFGTAAVRGLAPVGSPAAGPTPGR